MEVNASFRNFHFGFSTVNHSCVQRCLRRRLKRYRLSADLCRFAPSSHRHWQDDCVPNPQCPSCMTACIPHHHRFLSDNGGSAYCQSPVGRPNRHGIVRRYQKEETIAAFTQQIGNDGGERKAVVYTVDPFLPAATSSPLCIAVCVVCVRAHLKGT